MTLIALITSATSPPALPTGSKRTDRRAFKELKHVQTDAWQAIAPRFELSSQFSEHIHGRAFMDAQNAMHAALELTLEGVWKRDDLDYSSWGYEQMSPMLLLLNANPRFWYRLYEELLVDEMLWVVLTQGPYPHERLLDELRLRLTDTIEPTFS